MKSKTLKTRTFRELHTNPKKPLILPNIWDIAGARLIESLGAKAVATTSAGVAWSLGYPDGNYMPARLQARLAEEIVKAVKVPVSVDFEAGYSNKPSVVVENLKPLAAVGIAGINIEDGTDAPTLLVKKIEAIKKLTSSLGVDIFVNARTEFICRIWWLTKRSCKRLWTARRFINRPAPTVCSCLVSRTFPKSLKSPKEPNCRSILCPRPCCQ